ncbi:urea transport system ATP-binding protein [Chitinophaga terrae (ex Kim and Jung 2007)]|jgi:urea transport system ATP-binding protein|uniref:Urea transport system ATP-binding protein n=1 Tax=Chitinophaga terrae (ex Kim and Jung 2007) TaxID=408074 RepID=A0A1H4G8A9_9BACT|nr:urea ABC transporter ATP-binding protein UrtD [Chitinophaga terrae (ex Kim and Jung 2007)]MDQ0109084.1 urea transport system ATP-binding protein [Chitinophaga terrae (ex Kim and Jung 2007)]GEP93205.1 ABC transporter ATP-binding protein [Chitinophaga terrae (ex Kim and Jung 2007)]SEB05883.1 urea transport system ATP-binding protein [Chitinophaga terrae (ex Kim and Jung 2007)]
MLLTVNNLSVSFGGVHALHLDHFSLGEKELRVIIGPNGAGKSTFLDIICGKTKADSGEVIFKGKPVLGKSEVQIAELGIGRKFQKPSVFPELTVYDNLLLAVKTKKDIFSTLFFKVSPAIAERIHDVAARLQLNTVIYKQAGALSHGQKQWLEIAIVMLQDPTLMLIDEPAAGMSDEETEKTGALLLELANTHSIIVIEHDMKFVEQIANHLVTVLVRGKRLMEGTFEEVKNDQRVIDCYLGRTNAQLETL